MCRVTALFWNTLEWYVSRAEFNGNYNNTDFVLMPFTGRSDKRGTEIYKRDILSPKGQTIKSWKNGDGERAVVEWDEDASKWDMEFYSIHGGEGHLSWEESLNSRVKNGWQVIGNVYENPELLVVGRDQCKEKH
jgi:uncharacterized phage protein (TIGR01671 family)